MFLHIGNNKVIPISDIIAIIDVNSFNSSKEMKGFIDKYSENIDLNDDEDSFIKSYIIAYEKEKTNIYTSNISSSTLLKRCENIENIYRK